MNARPAPDRVAGARSLLFVPGTRSDRFAKAAASGSDLAIIDLEDAVPEEEKESARAQAAEWLFAHGVAAVRVNPEQSPHHDADIATLSGAPGLAAVVLPKAGSPETLAHMHAELGAQVALIAQVETATGLTRAGDLAAEPGVERLAFGHLDFAVDIDAAPESDSLAYARACLVVASRAAGLAGPIDSVTTDLDDEQVTHVDAVASRRIGFTGKLCIHPRQVATVNAAMSPTDAEVSWAQRVLAAATTGATRIDGQMVDAPVVARAERILDHAGRTR